MFPRKTLYRHLKQLCEEGLVKKEVAPRKEGETGRVKILETVLKKINDDLSAAWILDKNVYCGIAPLENGTPARAGRKSVIYRSNVNVFWSAPTKWLPPPGKKDGGQWFPGAGIQEGIRARRIGDLARQSHVRLSGQELKDYKEAKRQLKNPPPAPDPRILEERRRARAEIIRKALEGCARAQTS
jgi:hypothetical protein